jgi:outer membrane lipoprotein-sorting protein
MRKVSILALALALGAPMAAAAATTPADLQNLVAAYEGVQSVRVVERFENGAVATVDVLPAGQYRIAENGGQDPALILHIATQPIDGARWDGTYAVKSLGRKTIEGVSASGYRISSPQGDFNETVWMNRANNLPISSHVETQGHQIDVTYGNYNNTSLIATP